MKSEVGVPVRLGPIPALHSLSMFVISAIIFTSLLISVAVEIKETRWLWRRYKTPLQWLMSPPWDTSL
ncbi:Elongation of fatty acids protein 3-like [Glycine max]|nr:Elongation of fatty acids protein 3-like [Glycine max]